MRECYQQFLIMLRHALHNEWADRERLISPLLFAMTFILLCWFAMGELADEYKLRLFVGQSFLAAFVAMQISFLRMYDPDEENGAFDLLRTMPLSGSAWFASRFIVVTLLGFAILLPTMLLGTYFHGLDFSLIFSWFTLLVACLVLFGLSAIGVLLATMTLRVQAKHILFPIIYFPLTVPVLLSAVQACLGHWQDGIEISELLSSWLGLLIAFDVIYLSLSWLLFDELIKPE